jgi:UDP-3-O-[3-hydroxymyristoyl] glucosamine N-acyltransferase
MLIYIEDKRYLSFLGKNPNVACVMTSQVLSGSIPDGYGVVISDDPARNFFKLHNHLADRTSFYGEDFDSDIAPDLVVAPGVYISPKNVRISHGVTIEPNVVILPHTIIDGGVILRAGCVIGTQGFQFKKRGTEVLPIAHAGGVWLHQRVEVQANSAIARGVFGGYTEIGADTKIDSLVYIAHNAKIGKRCLLIASSEVSGSVIVGDDVWIGPGAVISNGVTIGDRATVSLGAVVVRDVSPDERVSGNFAMEHKKFLRLQAVMSRSPKQGR